MKEKEPLEGYMKYSTMAFEMAATIAVGVGLGHLADWKFHIAPYGKATGAFLFVLIAIYRVVKDFLK
jgi:F0F1-type ATP synthase assembly protein I